MRKPPATTAILYCVFATYAKPAVAAVREVSRRLARLAEYCASVLIEIPENRLRLGLEFMVESRADDLATLDGAEGRLRHNDHVGSMGCLLLRKTRGGAEDSQPVETSSSGVGIMPSATYVLPRTIRMFVVMFVSP
jgi:hypothetical protein